MDRLERLINLSAALLAAERPLTRVELRDRIPGYPDDDASFRRAFERDKEALRGMGMPVSIEPLDTQNSDSPEGYRVRREQYELADPNLAADELAALHLAVKAVRLEGAETTAAIWKLGGATDVAEPATGVAIEGSEHLPLLFACVSERRPVEFMYKGDARAIDPWRLAFRNGYWYLTGRDHGRDAERHFRLDRMTGPRVTGAPASFDRPEGAAHGLARSWAMGDEEPVRAQLVVDADQANWASAFIGAERILERRADGSIVFELEVTNRAAFRTLAVDFLEHAEVLGPPDVRADLLRWLEAIA